ncbi:hypothetical protein LZ198_26295 [Myxococcus sp. K15C18031901]|uniref:hypothetical protein n=1 Tax=Myxococcus dinghuensis TaxID=2906761 RepID=UPI0020A7C538|nr:hypothetical protein [Myxococcus dinghuensis]MCP3102387.1 hypothetical protein [Myxococcus dinghuensis]
MRVPPIFRAPTTRAFLLVALSFFVWSGWVVTVRYKPLFGGLSGAFSDHASHLSAARLFTWCGSCIWRKPANQLLRPLSVEEVRDLHVEQFTSLTRIPVDLTFFEMPGGPDDKPLTMSWAYLPRPYPPGVLLLVAPVALLYQFTPLSFQASNLLLILLFLLYTHVGFFVVIRCAPWGEGRWASVMGPLGAFLLYFEAIHWTLDGLYDGAMLAPLVLCGHFLRQRRGLAALVCYCIAAFIHFRAFFFAPLPLYAVYLVLKDWKHQRWDDRQGAELAAIIVLGFSSLYTFWLTMPWLTSFPLTNPLRRELNFEGTHLAFLVMLVGAMLLYAHAWLDVVLMGWMAWMCSRVYQTQGWHALVLMMWMVLPAWTHRDDRLSFVRDARILFVWAMTVLVYREIILPGKWILYLSSSM